ncbi:hypothetical protein ACLOJK_015344 [Asimina triloba]
MLLRRRWRVNSSSSSFENSPNSTTSRCFFRTAAVFSFGDNSHGALGLPAADPHAYEPTHIPGLPPHLSAVAAGHYHSLALTSGGHLWAWGRDQEAQLGRGSPSPSHCPLQPNDVSESVALSLSALHPLCRYFLPCNTFLLTFCSLSDDRDSWNQPKRVEGLDQVRVKAASASGVISSAIGEDGSLWVWGKSKRGQLGLGKGVTEAMVPSKVEALADENIVKVALGWGHALALTRDGKLFGWGYAAEGRLGQLGESLERSSSSTVASAGAGDSASKMDTVEKLVLEEIKKEKNMPIIWEPCLLPELHGREVLDISCGLDHSVVICCDGTLLSGGSNVYGQLGRATEGSKILPVDMSFWPVSISSGLGHSLAVCKIPSAEVAEEIGILTWGWNKTFQLGRQGPENFPATVQGLEGEKTISVSGGRAHSIALTSKKEIWVWGCGKNGRLGLGSSADEVEPALLDCLTGYEILQATAGFDHTLVLAIHHIFVSHKIPANNFIMKSWTSSLAESDICGWQPLQGFPGLVPGSISRDKAAVCLPLQLGGRGIGGFVIDVAAVSCPWNMMIVLAFLCGYY